MSVTTRHLRPVPNESDPSPLWAAIEKRHLQAAAKRMRDDAMEFAAKATASGDMQMARHFSRAVTHLNEAVGRG